MDAAPADDPAALYPDRHPHHPRQAQPGGGARLERGRPQPGGPRRLLPDLRAGRRGAVLLRTVPGGLRPGAPQGAGRLVYPHRGGAVHGGAGGHRAPGGAPHRGRAGRPAGDGARSLLRYRRLPGGGAAPDRDDAQGEGRRRTAGAGPQAGRHRAGVRLRAAARALRGEPPAARPAAQPGRRAPREGEPRAGGGCSSPTRSPDGSPRRSPSST